MKWCVLGNSIYEVLTQFKFFLKHPYNPRAEVCVSVNSGVWSEGPPLYHKQQGRLLNRRELRGLFVSHGIKLPRSISFSVTQRHYSLLVKSNTHTHTHTHTVSEFCFSHFLWKMYKCINVNVIFSFYIFVYIFVFHKSQKNVNVL